MVIERADSTSNIVHVSYHDAYAPGFEDLRRRVPDIAKIRTAVGWQPERSLEEILDDVIAYERQRLLHSSKREV